MNNDLANLITASLAPTFRLGRYRISRACSPHEKHEIYRFRCREYREAGYLSPSAFADGLMTDEFDEFAIQIAVFDENDTVIGSTRFVPPNPIGFLTERLYSFELPPSVDRARLGELGRLAIEKSHRGGARMVTLFMLKAVFDCMVECRVDNVIAFLGTRLADSFARFGCKAIPIVTGPPSPNMIQRRSTMTPYFESQRADPVIYDLEEMLVTVGVVEKFSLDPNRRS